MHLLSEVKTRLLQLSMSSKQALWHSSLFKLLPLSVLCPYYDPPHSLSFIFKLKSRADGVISYRSHSTESHFDGEAHVDP